MAGVYTQGRRLGQGSFGVINLCTKIETGEVFACKCIEKSKITTPKLCEMVQREVLILQMINHRQHPSFISIKDVWEDHECLYIVMKLCKGGNLYTHIETHGPVTEPRGAQIIKEVVCAIQQCHSIGIVHRDVKLDNLMFLTRREDSAIKMIDFGLSQFFRPSEELTDIVGSAGFVAPEVVEEHHGPKVDIWSAGVVLYVLLSGFYPFEGTTLEETYRSVMRGCDIFEENPWPRISVGAKDLIMKMLTYDVSERLCASEVLRHPWILENVV